MEQVIDYLKDSHHIDISFLADVPPAVLVAGGVVATTMVYSLVKICVSQGPDEEEGESTSHKGKSKSKKKKIKARKNEAHKDDEDDAYDGLEVNVKKGVAQGVEPTASEESPTASDSGAGGNNKKRKKKKKVTYTYKLHPYFITLYTCYMYL